MKWLVVGLALVSSAIPSVASAEPSIRIDPPSRDCQQPRYIAASGLPPSKAIEVAIILSGVESGAVGGTSDAQGTFASPIPNFLLPCEVGGTVTARVRIDGVLTPAATDFIVLGRNQPPLVPGVGDSPPVTQPSDDWMFVSAIGGGCLLLTLVLVLIGPRRDRRR